MKTKTQKTVQTTKSARKNAVAADAMAESAPSAVAPEIQMVSKLILDGWQQRTTDIHLDPLASGALQVRFRIDGLMQPRQEFAPAMAAQVLNRLKIMAGMDLAEKRLPQDGRIQVKLKDSILDLRLSLIPTVHGERITMRLLNSDMLKNVPLDKFDMGGENLQRLRRTLDGSGMVICSGPTGSGKTTVLYSLMAEINNGSKNLFSVENPVEYILPGVSQVKVQPHIGLTFSAALRAIFRQDPDAIMISELRDYETLLAAAQGSLTGHLVLTQLHTNSAAEALKRLLDIGLEPFLAGDAVAAVINQRLVRKLCMHCRKPTALPVARLPKAFAESAENFAGAKFYAPVGCEKCKNTGYQGRAAIFEILFMSEKLKDALCAKADAKVLHAIAREGGMTTLMQDAIRKAAAGVTSIEEVMRVVGGTQE